MKPQYTRFVVSSNNNLQFNSQLQSSSNFKPIHEGVQQQNSISSIRVLNGIISSPTATLPTRLIITKNPTTINCSNQIAPLAINKSTTHAASLEKTNLSFIDTPVTESKIVESLSLQKTRNTNTFTTTSKSTSSSSKLESDLVCVESGENKTKETIKIHKDKKKGERPYNDDSLLTDSMVIQEAQLVDVENNSPIDLNATQISQSVNDCVITSNVEETASSNFNIVNESPSSSRNNFIMKSGTPTINNTTKKNNKLKKKRTSEIKLDLMQELLGKINDANEAACRSESQCQQLLHKYRRNLNILNQLIITLLSHLDNSLQINCRAVWCLNRNATWWNDVVPHMTDKEFKSNFRLERSTYSDLLQQISPYLQKSNTKFRRMQN
ncbi:unnamed protein product [Rotaria sp. Silwood2]|nr:unnamed protein product [Rotaria sp. Silwood2]